MRVIIALMIFLALSGVSSASELTIGLIPEQNVFKQMKRYEPIGEYIEKKVNIKVRFTTLTRYGNIISSFESEKMDAAFWGSFTGGLAINQLGIIPIARPVWLDDTSTYHGYIFVRKDSGIKNAADMKGKTIAFVDKATTAGYVFPVAYLNEHGIKDIDSYFKEYYFAGSHDATILAVLDNKVDIGCAKNTIFNVIADRDPRVKEEIVILARSPVVPSNGLAIRKDLDPEIQKKLLEVLLKMDSDPDGVEALRKFGAKRFIKTTVDDYRPLFDIAQKAGIDLKKYRYINK